MKTIKGRLTATLGLLLLLFATLTSTTPVTTITAASDQCVYTIEHMYADDDTVDIIEEGRTTGPPIMAQLGGSPTTTTTSGLKVSTFKACKALGIEKSSLIQSSIGGGSGSNSDSDNKIKGTIQGSQWTSLNGKTIVLDPQSGWFAFYLDGDQVNEDDDIGTPARPTKEEFTSVYDMKTKGYLQGPKRCGRIVFQAP